jgi:flagellar basal-body rod modification protein FlgD
MTVSSVTDPTIVNTTATDSASAQQSLADNFSTFLTLLTSQLQNQDPLSPMDSTQFTQQLVQFSQVEQQIKTNQNLEGLAQQYQAASAGAALSYLGRSAVLEGDTAALSNGQASWSYTLPNTAGTVRLEVRDSANRTLYSANGDLGAGTHVFSWDGTDSNGNTVPAGDYKLVVTATDANGNAITPTLMTTEVIRGVDFTQTTPQVITDSGSHGIDTIRAILG